MRWIEIYAYLCFKLMIFVTDEVSAYSKSCVGDEIQTKQYESKKVLGREIKNQILNLIYKWREQQLLKLSQIGGKDGML